MPTVAARIQQILDETQLSARALSEAIGASHAFVDTILNGRSKAPSANRLQKIAEYTGYSLVWIQTGRGPRRSDSPDSRAERYAAMPAVRSMARAQGYDEAFVASWDVHLDADDQPDADYLWTLCKADYARWTRKTAAKGDPLSDFDDAPRKRGT